MALNSDSNYEVLEKNLQKSKTAYNPGIKPTQSDISQQISLARAQKKEVAAADEALRKRWYGEETDDENAGKEREKGLLTKALTTLGAPLSGVAGAVETVLGKGTEPGLGNIVANMEERGTFGDILRSYDVNNAVAMPLGLALDVFADPISWATLGTSATVPRVLAGLQKGGAKGLFLGAKSAALMRAEGAGKMVPGLTRRAFAISDNKKGPVASFYKKLALESEEAAKEYDTMLGKTLEDRLLAQANKGTAFEQIGKFIPKNKVTQKIKDIFGYSNKSWMAAERAKANEKMLAKGAKIDELYPDYNDFLPSTSVGDKIEKMDDGRAIERNLIDSADAISNDTFTRAADSEGVFARMQNLARTSPEYTQALEKEIMEARSLLYEKGLTKQAGKLDELLAETGEKGLKNKEKAAGVYTYFKTGIADYDKNIGRIISSDKGRKIMNAYATYVGMFKNAKIGGNLPSSGMFSLVGNLAMTSMVGIDIANAAYARSMGKAIKVLKGDTTAAREIMNQPDIIRTIEQYPDLFEGIFGISPKLVTQGRAYIDDIAREFLKQGGKESDVAEVMKMFDETLGAKGVDEAASKVGDIISKAVKNVNAKQTSTLASLERGMPSTFISSEIMRGPYGMFRNRVGEMADADKPFAKFLHWYMSKPMEYYNKIDQTYRLGQALHLSQEGITARELGLLSKRVRIMPGDVQKVAGRDLYKVNFDKAMDVATETYMNYLAMPAFVQIMRTFPLLGSPFFSFAYGMGALGLQSVAANPAFFNKVQFLLKEISGEKSPLEKEQLAGKYYNWYNQEGMVKLNMLPFMQDNPVYLNAENLIPYYTMTMFQPTERTYQSRFGDTVAKIVDNVPFLKTPEGQVLFDYVVLPSMIGGEQPQGAFGQPLWPIDATAAEKVGLTARAAAETLAPPVAGYAGLFTPSTIAEYIPNYRWRQMAYAKEGKGSLGVQTKESPLSKTARVGAALAGLPTYQMKLNYSKEQ